MIASWLAAGIHPVGVAGLASAWMGLWVAAASIPIVIHFWNRRHRQHTPWAAMQLLQRVLKQESRRLLVEQWILLAIRVSILALLALGLARPFLEAETVESVTRREPRLWLFIVDTSYSMGYEMQSGKTRFQTARAKIAERLESSSQGDAFALVALAQPSAELLCKPTFDTGSFRSQVDAMQQRDTGSDATQCLSFSNGLLDDWKTDPNLPRDVQTIVLSDFGVDAWRRVVSDSSNDTSAQLLQELQQKSSVQFENFGTTDPTNLAVVDVGLQPPKVLVGKVSEVRAQIACVGRNALQVPVQFKVNGKTVASTLVDVDGGGSQEVTFDFVPDSSGEFILTLELPDDRLDADNARSLVVEARDRNRILLVEDSPGDSFVLQLALNPSRSATEAPDILQSYELAVTNFADWDLIFLNDLGSLSLSSQDRLQEFVKQGGTVVSMLGPNTQADSWNEFKVDGTPILGCELLGVSVLGEYSIDPLDYTSSFAAPFQEFPESGLLTTPIFRYWRTKDLLAPGELVVDLALVGGDPFIVRRKYGEGWIASVFSAPASVAVESSVSDSRVLEPWNAIATWPSFLPLVQSMVREIVPDEAQARNLWTGDILTGKFRSEVPNPKAMVTLPDASLVEVVADRSTPEGLFTWEYSAIQRGIYVVRAESSVGTAGAAQSYAVNVNPSESGLSSFPSEQLPRSNRTEYVETANAPPDFGGNDTIAKVILFLVGALLVSESAFAVWLGRRVK